MNEPSAPVRRIGRYAIFGEIAAGGMATVHLGRLLGPVGFARTVAVKQLHPTFARDPELASMFLDEARLAGRIHHPNAVSTIDVVASGGEIYLVMEYVHGAPLSRLLKALRNEGQTAPAAVAWSVISGALHGLHAAHEARDDRGQPLGIVHRDVSPQNVMVGLDGVPRVLDFGVAKAAGRLQTTREGQLKGKLAYMAPELFAGASPDRRVDVYAASVVLWEALVGRRCFDADNEALAVARILEGATVPPSRLRPDLSPAVDAVVMRGLARDPAVRFATAREMAMAMEDVLAPASQARVGEWVERVAGGALVELTRRIAEIERQSSEMTPLALPEGPTPAPRAGSSVDEAPTEVSDAELSMPMLPPIVPPGPAPSEVSPPPSFPTERLAAATAPHATSNVPPPSPSSSSISVSAPRETPPRPAGGARWAAGLAVAALLGAAGLITTLVLGRDGTPAVPRAAPAAESPTVGAAAPPAEPPPPQVATDAPSTAAEPVAPSTSASAPATASAQAPSPTPSASARPSTPRVTPAAPPRPPVRFTRPD